MLRLRASLLLAFALVAWLVSLATDRASASVACARTADPAGASVAADPGSPAPGSACWIEVTPYPFGFDGDPVDPTRQRCTLDGTPAPITCYLVATSFAFRAPNRGLAAVSSQAFGVWLFNGARWFPDPTFPGRAVCAGNVVLWAGKRDYWLVGPGTGTWPSLCRFDGTIFEWIPLRLPAATTARVTLPNGRLAPGGINSGACFAWNDCTFFGTHGAVVRWDGAQLRDQSPDPGLPWEAGAYTAAAVQRDAAGNAFGVVLSATAATLSDGPVPVGPDGVPTSLLRSSGGGPWTPVALDVPTAPQPGDPSRTDLVAVTLDPSGTGWVAGNPAGFRRFADGSPSRPAAQGPEPAPLIPVTPLGRDAACPGPAPAAFSFQRDAFAPASLGRSATLWSALAAFPGGASVLAGGQFRRAQNVTRVVNQNDAPEALLAVVGCDGSVARTAFRMVDPTWVRPRGCTGCTAPLVMAHRNAGVAALSVTAANDAWASVGPSALLTPQGRDYPLPPRLYRLTDGLAPTAPAGDDLEERPVAELQIEPTPFETPPPEPPAPPPIVQEQVVTQKPAIFQVKVTVRKTTLVVGFRVRRPVRIGVAAFRKGKQVATTGIRSFGRGRHELRLQLDPKRWPTGVRFVTPKAADGA